MFTWVFGMSRRWEMAFLLFSGVCFVYTLRVNISVSATAMESDLGWTNDQKGLVLSSFYWGYTAGQIPASRLIQKYGGKWIFGLSILIPGILTLLCPFVFRKSFGGGLAIRCILGFFESASFPAVYYFFHEWIPAAERTLMVGTITSGTYLGEILGFALSGYLVGAPIMINGSDFGHWPATFYIFGLMSIFWFPFWAYFAYDKPELHPYISQEEKELIIGSHSEGRGEDEFYFIGMASGMDGSVAPVKPYNLPKTRRSHSTVTIKRPSFFDKNAKDKLNEETDDVEGHYPVRRRTKSVNLEMRESASDVGQPSLAQLKQSLLAGYDPSIVGAVSNKNPNHENNSNNDDENSSDIKNSNNDDGNDDDDNNSNNNIKNNNMSKKSFSSKPSNVNRKDAIGVYNDSEEFDEHRAHNTDSRKSEYQDLKTFQKDMKDYSARRSVKAPTVTDSEKQHSDHNDLENNIPWVEFVTHKESLTLFMAHFVFGYISFMLISEMPSFLVDQLDFSIEEAGGLSSIPFVFLFLTVQASGRFFDYALTSLNWDVHSVRQVAQISSYSGVTIFLVACGFATEKFTAFALLVVAQALLGLSLCGIACAYLDLAPVYSCPMNTIGNTLAAVAGILGPIVVSGITSAIPGEWGWRISFMTAGALCLISIITWRLYQISTIVPALNTPKGQHLSFK